jgi:hypothetical protein
MFSQKSGIPSFYSRGSTDNPRTCLNGCVLFRLSSNLEKLLNNSGKCLEHLGVEFRRSGAKSPALCPCLV